jgi:hypothetical protein
MHAHIEWFRYIITTVIKSHYQEMLFHRISHPGYVNVMCSDFCHRVSVAIYFLLDKLLSHRHLSFIQSLCSVQISCYVSKWKTSGM